MQRQVHVQDRLCRLRRRIQLVVPSDPDFCRAVVRRVLKPVRAPGPQSGRVHEQVFTCLSAEARTGAGR